MNALKRFGLVVLIIVCATIPYWIGAYITPLYGFSLPHYEECWVETHFEDWWWGFMQFIFLITFFVVTGLLVELAMWILTGKDFWSKILK